MTSRLCCVCTAACTGQSVWLRTWVIYAVILFLMLLSLSCPLPALQSPLTLHRLQGPTELVIILRSDTSQGPLPSRTGFGMKRIRVTFKLPWGNWAWIRPHGETCKSQLPGPGVVQICSGPFRSSAPLLCPTAILSELLQRENRVLHFWTLKKRRLDQCQQYVVFERSAKQVCPQLDLALPHFWGLGGYPDDHSTGQPRGGSQQQAE